MIHDGILCSDIEYIYTLGAWMRWLSVAVKTMVFRNHFEFTSDRFAFLTTKITPCEGVVAALRNGRHENAA